MFANRIFHSKIEHKQQNRPDAPRMLNGLIQHITVEESTSIHVQWVNQEVYEKSDPRSMGFAQTTLVQIFWVQACLVIV